MKETFIAKGDSGVLSRVSLQVGDEKYTIETVFSDSSTLELAMRCLEAYCFSHGWSREDIISAMKETLSKNGIDKVKFLTNTTITITVEQYDNRMISSREASICGNIIQTMLDCFISVNILTTWSKDSIFDWMREYIEEYGGEELEPVELNDEWPKD